MPNRLVKLSERGIEAPVEWLLDLLDPLTYSRAVQDFQHAVDHLAESGALREENELAELILEGPEFAHLDPGERLTAGSEKYGTEFAIRRLETAFNERDLYEHGPGPRAFELVGLLVVFGACIAAGLALILEILKLAGMVR